MLGCSLFLGELRIEGSGGRQTRELSPSGDHVRPSCTSRASPRTSLRYAAGVVFMVRRKTSVKWLCEENPTARETSVIGRWGSCKSSQAQAIRSSVT